MAEFSDDQNPFNCPICLHLLKDPVTTACGHSFCMNCIKECWDQDDQKGVYSCPQCRQIFTPRPVLNRSTVLAELVGKMKREEPQAVEATPQKSSAGSGDVECDVCMETKLKAIKFCLVCVASYCESHIQTHYISPAFKRHKLVNASPHLLEQICSQHDKPLELYCCQDQQLICMQCALINHQNHRMASPAAKRQEIQGQVESNQHSLQEEIHNREMKVQEVKQAIGFHKSSAQEAVKQTKKIFTELISSMEKDQAKITENIRNQEKAEEIKAEELIRVLEQEIIDLRRRNEKLGQLSQIDNDICFIQNFSSIYNYQCSNLCNIPVYQHLTFEEIPTILSELKSQLNDLCEQDTVRISEKVPTIHILNNEKTTKYLPSQPKTREEFLIYSSELSLNHQSACDQLSVRNNIVSRCVTSSQALSGFGQVSPMAKYVIDSDFSFGSQPRVYKSSTYQVLCNKNLSGRCYFEVEYTGTGCSVAFSYDQFSKSGRNFTFGCNNRSWIFHFSHACINMSHNNISTNIPTGSSKIGVYLDHSAGTLSFYNVSDKMTLLHRAQTTFTKPLYPGFSLQKWANGSVNICDLPFTVTSK
ncbi:E3 ubiquitin/ISG15 ligase TRIM25-like [Paramisgurnus dabryanus]|uniref:E3 ubiquitin/ISG15 ligase TRIM25-like n=1 Tax=Paramisgurnus dabryanus TaxID=90735 RepID=UPI0031F45A74